MIVPVDHAQADRLAGGALPQTLRLGEVTLVRKAEHHMTALNYGIGKLVKKAIAARRELRDEITQMATSFDWKLEPGQGGFVHLVQDGDGRPPLQTIIVLIDSALHSFYDQLRAQVADQAELAQALGAPPPPHITLYTSDPSGKAGIGLNRVAELEAAFANSGPGLRAIRLEPSAVRPPV